ncbi:hypothetical protein JCM10212_003870 [Sporobolomyces blumeae]
MLNYSSAFSTRARRPEGAPVLGSLETATSTLAEADVSVLLDPSLGDLDAFFNTTAGDVLRDEDEDAPGTGQAGPGPRSTASIAARTRSDVDPYRLPSPPADESTVEMLEERDATVPRRGERVEVSDTLPVTNETGERTAPELPSEQATRESGGPRPTRSGIDSGGLVDAVDSRGTSPPTKRGRPREDGNMDAPSTAPTSDLRPSLTTAAPRRDPRQDPNRVEAYFPDLLPTRPDQQPSPADVDSDASSGTSDSTESGRMMRDSGGGQKKKRKKKKTKRGPIVPKLFRDVASADHGDVLENVRGQGEAPSGLANEGPLSSEQRQELERAMNPAFATHLLSVLSRDEQYYEQAKRALQHELIAAQIEESYLEHVKEVAVRTRDKIRSTAEKEREQSSG